MCTTFFAPEGGGGGGRGRVRPYLWCFSRFGLKEDINFDHLGLK